MCHMGQLNAGEWLDLGPYRRMSLFICHATGGRCEDWDPWKGANRVVLQTTIDDGLYDGPPTVRVYKRVKLTLSQGLDEAQFLATARKQKMSARDVRSALRHDKLGGMPVWLQGDATPRGVDGRKMRLLMQFTTEVVKFDITPRGVGYVYFDPSEPEEHAARLIWQGE